MVIKLAFFISLSYIVGSQDITVVCMQRVLILIGISLFLTACDSVKSTLGMDHYQADEFNIKQNDPLSMPPNYKLMPPRTKDKDGKSVPLNPSAEKAKKVVGGGESETSISEVSQQDLKDKVGSTDETIRETIDKESAQTDDNALDNKLASWKKEFVQNAKSINKPKTAKNKRPVEKLKEQLEHEPAPEHQESLESKVENEMERKAIADEAEKNLVNPDKAAELRDN